MKIKFTPFQKPWLWEEPSLRDVSRFRTTYSETLKKLKDELEKIDASGAILELDFSKDEISINGFPKSGCRQKSPRVRLSFIHPEAGLLEYPCDTYLDFQANVRAIALTLENLRALNRLYCIKKRQRLRNLSLNFDCSKKVRTQVHPYVPLFHVQ